MVVEVVVDMVNLEKQLMHLVVVDVVMKVLVFPVELEDPKEILEEVDLHFMDLQEDIMVVEEVVLVVLVITLHLDRIRELVDLVDLVPLIQHMPHLLLHPQFQHQLHQNQILQAIH